MAVHVVVALQMVVHMVMAVHAVMALLLAVHAVMVALPLQLLSTTLRTRMSLHRLRSGLMLRRAAALSRSWTVGEAISTGGAGDSLWPTVALSSLTERLWHVTWGSSLCHGGVASPP